MVGGVLESNKGWDIAGKVTNCISKVFPGAHPIRPEVCVISSLLLFFFIIITHSRSYRMAIYCEKCRFAACFDRFRPLVKLHWESETQVLYFYNWVHNLHSTSVLVLYDDFFDNTTNLKIRDPIVKSEVANQFEISPKSRGTVVFLRR